MLSRRHLLLAGTAAVASPSIAAAQTAAPAPCTRRSRSGGDMAARNGTRRSTASTSAINLYERAGFRGCGVLPHAIRLALGSLALDSLELALQTVRRVVEAHSY